jgi:hypothetical protein
MTELELERLRSRIAAGELPTEDLWALRKANLDLVDAKKAEALSDVWNLAFHRKGLFPQLEAAKALVETALAANTPYPILTNDGLIYDSLTSAERHDLVQFIRERTGGSGVQLADILNEFVEDLIGSGPHF